MARENILLISIILLSVAFANALLLDDTVSTDYLRIQIGYAANEITQTSSEINNCDPSNKCSSFPGQNAIIESGDGNDISQGSIQVNRCKFSNPAPDTPPLCDIFTEQNANIESGNGNHMSQDLSFVNQCVDAAFCGVGGIQTQAIGQTQRGEVFDEGTDNENLQTNTNDPKSLNDNTAIQVVEGETLNCIDGAECGNGFQDNIVLGHGNLEFMRFIENFGESNNNTNIQTNNNFDSIKGNSIEHTSNLQNTKCENEFVFACGNGVIFSSNIAVNQGGRGIGGQSLVIVNSNANDNINIQNNTSVESRSGNIILKEAKLDNNACDVVFECTNLVREATSIGQGSLVVGIGNIGTNNGINVQDNFNLQSILNKGSGNGNIDVSKTTASNSNCRTAFECSNLVFSSESSIGDIGSVGVTNGFSGSQQNSEHNTNILSVFNIDSSNANEVTRNIELVNKDCGLTTFCSNTISEIGSTIGRQTNTDSIFNVGSDNSNSIVTTAVESNNNNIINENVNQGNVGCNNETTCNNEVIASAFVGVSVNHGISSQGNNNTISNLISLSKSNNDNKIQQELDQQNKNCEEVTNCNNFIDVGANIGASRTVLIENTGNNNIINNSIINTNSNNNNDIEQIAEQANSHCSASTCYNSGAIKTEIGSITVDPIVDRISNTGDNKVITNSESSINTNNNNKISQQLDQFNLCRTSYCANIGNLSASIDEENNKNLDQSLDQNNLCLNNAVCNNDGKVIGISGSNTQSNTCIAGASCSNSGTDNENICTNGATCTNAGINTKVVSNGDPCAPQSDNSETICSHGRIITRPS